MADMQQNILDRVHVANVERPRLSTTPPAESDQNARKMAACLSCRSIKIKCVRDEGATACTRCLNKGTRCTIPEYRVGRRKGVPNKRRGLDKAIHQLEQALHDVKASGENPENENTALRLHQLLGEAGAVLNRAHSRSNSIPSASVTLVAPPVGAFRSQPAHVQHQNSQADRVIVEDTENPLQLLAHATEQCLPLPQLSSGQTSTTLTSSTETRHQGGRADELLRRFFGPPRVNLDVGPSLDPISLGFVTAIEAEDLVNYFHQNLAHTRWGLDPAIHTAHFIRQRSAFLFTTVMAASAKFLPTAAALSTRLTAHCKTLANHVMNNRCRSVEIVIAFMFNVPWLPAGEQWEDDEGSSFLANALAMALDLSLDKVIVHTSDSGSRDGLAGRDVVDARKALAIDGFDSVDSTSLLGKRLLRRRERAWLSLFILDRGFCMARERRSLFPVDTPLLERCDGWHISELAASNDSSLISIAVIRRDLIDLIGRVKSRCDNYQSSVDDGTAVAESIRDMIESFLENWFATWAPVVADWKGNQLPPYVEILSCHTRLSIYGLVMNHPTAPLSVHRFFRVGGLSASINVMRTAVQGEALWKSVPNNTVIMIAFAACLALRLSNTHPETTPSIAQSVRDLVYQTADVFERIGKSPSHREGASVLYALHLRAMVGRYIVESAQPGSVVATSAIPVVDQRNSPASGWQGYGQDASHDQQPQQQQQQQQQNLNQPLFAEMSDVEFSEALKSVENELFASEGDISAHWWNNLDWLTWDDRVSEEFRFS